MSVVADYRSFHLTSEVGRLGRGHPRRALGRSVRRVHGPLAGVHAHRCATPTLVTAGELDRCTPVEQGVQLYTAIAAAGAETELVIYPREGHVVVERAHALDQIRRTTEWFERHLRPADVDRARAPAPRVAARRAYDARVSAGTAPIIALIPGYQEGPRIASVVAAAARHLPVVVVDDGSTDDTAAQAEAAGATVLRQVPNAGKGAALRAGSDTPSTRRRRRRHARRGRPARP